MIIPPHEKIRLMPHELSWCGDPDSPLAADAWWARWILNLIGKSDRTWIATKRLSRDSEVYIGKQIPEAAFVLAARRSGARVRDDAVGYDMIACDRMFWDTVQTF